MGIDFRALARTAELVEPATEGTPGTGAGDSGTPCSYCGGTYFEPTEDNGRVLRTECEECGGTMVSHDGTYWQPDLIGSPHNHPSTQPDPASGGVGGAGAAPVKVREEDLSSRTAGANGPLPEGLEVQARPFEPGSDEHNDLENSYPGGKHGVIEAFVPERDDPIGSMEFSATPGQVHVHLTMVHSHYQRRGVATALNAKLREIYPDHPIDRGAASEDGEHFRRSLGSVDWCRHRHAEHCWLPSNYSSPPGLALWTPQDRGACPWATASQQQINCPMSEPGPMAGMTRAAAHGENVGPLLPVKHAGYKGFVEAYEGHEEELRDMDRQIDGGHHFDEDLWDEHTPEPNTHERAHYDEHDDYPDEYHERHEQDYEKALQKRQEDEAPVGHHTPLINFIHSHGNDHEFWGKHATLEDVDHSKHSVYATQPYVVQHHLNRYMANRQDTVHHVQEYGHSEANDLYPGTHHPMMVRHEGNLFAIEGHHRTASDILSGRPTKAFVYDADKHGFPEPSEDDMYEVDHEGLRKYSRRRVRRCDFQHEDPARAREHALYNHDDGVCVATEHKRAREKAQERANDHHPQKTSTWHDPELSFHMLAAWRDVRAKAVRIRREGGVSIVSVLADGITGHVHGDTGIYETQINYVPGSFKVGFWQCGCAWAAYAWGRSPAYRRFEGRMCSHALALTYEAQSRGMFGREVREDTERPSWMRQRTPVQVDYDRDSGERRRRRAVPPANMRRTYEGARQAALDPDGVYPSDHGLSLDRRPIEAFAALAYAQSGDPADAMRVFLAAGLEHTAARDLLLDALNGSIEQWGRMLDTYPDLQDLVDLGDHLYVGAATAYPGSEQHLTEPEVKMASADEPVYYHGTWHPDLHEGHTVQPGKKTGLGESTKVWLTDSRAAAEEYAQLGKPYPDGSEKPAVLRVRPLGPVSQSKRQGDPIYAEDGSSHRPTYFSTTHAEVTHREDLEPHPRYREAAEATARWQARQAAKDDEPEDPPTHAGVVLKAADTGRILMIQRSNKDPDDPAAGTWHRPSYFSTTHAEVVHREDVANPRQATKTAGYDMYGEWDGRDDDEESEARGREWDEIHSGIEHLHRGIGVMLTPHDHKIVHDESLPVEHRAKHLMNVLGTGGHHGGVGTHWTTERSVADDFASTGPTKHLADAAKQQAMQSGGHHWGTDADGDPKGQPATAVIFHAHPPERHAIDEQPDEMAHASSGMYDYHDHGEREVPIHPGHSLMLSGVSWKPVHHSFDEPEDEPEYAHHEFGGEGHHVTAAKDDQPEEPPTHAGVVLKAQDTGRVLMIQRSNKDEDDPARGKWEWPGGGREDGDHNSLHSAIREFEEETGQVFPTGGTVSHVWRSGPYQGHVVTVPSEDCLDFSGGRSTVNPDDPDGDDHEQSTWWHPDDARRNPALREECKSSPWAQIKAAALQRTADYAAHDWLEDVGVDPHPKAPPAAPEPGQPENPASTGFATSQDPPEWENAAQRAETMSMTMWSSLGELRSGHVPPGHAVDDLADCLGLQTEGASHADIGLARLRAHDADGDDDLFGQSGVRIVGAEVDRHDASAACLPVADVLAVGAQDPMLTVLAGTEVAGVPDVQLARLGDEVPVSPTVRVHHAGAAGSPVGAVPELAVSTLAESAGPRVAGAFRAACQRYMGQPTGLSGDLSGEHELQFSRNAELKDQPEPALPSTTADEEDVVEPPGERYRAQMRAEVPAEDAQLGGLNPTAAVSPAVAAFHASAGARALQNNGGPNDMDIAQAARQHLAGQGGIQRTALKDFTSAEQRELITEGVGQRARNFEDLKIEGTHYEAIQAALAAEAALEDPDDLFD